MDDFPCPDCGQTVAVGAWPWCGGTGQHGTFRPDHLAVVDDSCNMTIENMGPTPLHFTSKTEWRRVMKARGLTNVVKHVGTPGEGSDKSPFTSRWY